mgnify:CR=1 FL=1|tara:strand:+ start:1771 stop:1980 length:210 start_codon:yes stop_codon:yes gene_type:complete
MQNDDFGGTVYDYTPIQDKIISVKNAVKSCSKMPIYARVDVFLDDENKLTFAKLAKGIKERILDHEEIS